MKKLLSYYIISGILFLMVLTGVIISRQYGDSLYITQKKLQMVRMNLVSMNEAINDMEKTIAEIKAIVPSDFALKTPEELIFTGLDELKSKMNGYEIVATDIERKDGEVALPVTITRKAAAKDYASFVNGIGYLQSMSFPFCSISSISIKQSEDRAFVLYEIKGALKTLKAAGSRQ